MSAPRIGVLALQGDVAEHRAALRRCGAEDLAVRRAEQLEPLDGLVLPGGESTAIGWLCERFGMLEPLRAYLRSGRPAWGTCAGLILMARDAGHEQALLGGLDVVVDRNAFGRQVASFEADLTIAGLEGPPFRAVFIRAPSVRHAGPDVQVLARLPAGQIVAVRQGALIGTAFHPELAGDDRLHADFVRRCAAVRGARSSVA